MRYRFGGGNFYRSSLDNRGLCNLWGGWGVFAFFSLVVLLLFPLVITTITTALLTAWGWAYRPRAGAYARARSAD